MCANVKCTLLLNMYYAFLYCLIYTNNSITKRLIIIINALEFNNYNNNCLF